MDDNQVDDQYSEAASGPRFASAEWKTCCHHDQPQTTDVLTSTEWNYGPAVLAPREFVMICESESACKFLRGRIRNAQGVDYLWQLILADARHWLCARRTGNHRGRRSVHRGFMGCAPFLNGRLGDGGVGSDG
jgi:hypothetical protein